MTSHVIEHVPNLLAAYVESSRVVKDGGVFFCIFPNRNAEPTDRIRALTTLEQMIDAYEKRVDMSTIDAHLWRGHHLVFSLQSMLRAVNLINNVGLGHWLVESVEQTDSKVGNGHTVVLRKQVGLANLMIKDGAQLNHEIGTRLRAQDLTGALHLVKVALSFDFFNAYHLYLAFCPQLPAGQRSRGAGVPASGTDHRPGKRRVPPAVRAVHRRPVHQPCALTPPSRPHAGRFRRASNGTSHPVR
ncbi:hypothetical protein NWF32_24390 [Pseudomonas qingdaonensis]|nr:hypothetical protein [Pseudomonas qingdaonensis]